jgi:hypothetical protein
MAESMQNLYARVPADIVRRVERLAEKRAWPGAIPGRVRADVTREIILAGIDVVERRIAERATAPEGGKACVG